MRKRHVLTVQGAGRSHPVLKPGVRQMSEEHPCRDVHQRTMGIHAWQSGESKLEVQTLEIKTTVAPEGPLQEVVARAGILGNESVRKSLRGQRVRGKDKERKALEGKGWLTAP